MIKLRVGQDEDGMQSRLHGASGNNVEAPVSDESPDQERNISNKEDPDAKQKAKQQEHTDSTDPSSTAKGASGHRSGAPSAAGSGRDSDASTAAGNPKGHGAGKDRGTLKQDKDRHGGMSLDDEAKARQTDEGGPVNGAAPLRHRHGGSVGQRHHR